MLHVQMVTILKLGPAPRVNPNKTGRPQPPWFPGPPGSETSPVDSAQDGLLPCLLLSRTTRQSPRPYMGHPTRAEVVLAPVW